MSEVVILGIFVILFLPPIIIYSILFKEEKYKKTRNSMILSFTFGFMTLSTGMLLANIISNIIP